VDNKTTTAITLHRAIDFHCAIDQVIDFIESILGI
jgi:hypothetical protein